MPLSKLTPPTTLEQDRIEALKQLIPEAVTDGKIDWEVLKEALGEFAEEEGAEHFGLSWAGKREARRLAVTPSKGTLVPVEGEGIDEKTTKNLFIEGDNLEVLKLLQKSYAGKVKLIYVDPPYNTGNDFIYKDDYSEPTADYLRKTEQTDEAGKLLTTNPKTSGRFHSNWLSMMYPRLRLAKNLLRDDGVVFVSIDDNEVHNLRQLMNEIFGEENFVANVVWQKKYAVSSDAKGIPALHDSIIVFQRSQDFKPNLLPRTEKQDRAYQNLDNDSRGPWRPNNLTRSEYRERDCFPIVSPKTGKVFYPPKGCSWRHPRETIEQMIADDRIWFGKDGTSRPVPKLFLSEVRQGIVASAWWTHSEAGHNDESKKELQALFDGDSPFDTPKPIRLIKLMLAIVTTQSNDIVCDFFSGSGSTAHAVLELNKEDGGNRRFIMVQIPEETKNPEYPTIAEIGKERIRRVIKKIKEEREGQLDLAESEPQDLGFKVYKLDRSNLKIWENYEGTDIQDVQTQLFEHENKLLEGWTEAKVITELQLLEGFPLDSKVELVPDFTDNHVFSVTAPNIEHRLFICLSVKLHINTIQQVRLLPEEDAFICLDTALNDREKLMLADGCNVKTI